MEFDGILVKCIQDTIGGVMGVRVRDVVYLELLERFSVTREALPRHLESLESVLEKALGPVATRTISRAIARRLCSELHIDFSDKPHFRLVDYVSEIRNQMNRSEHSDQTKI